MSRRVLCSVALALAACGAAYVPPAVSPQLVDAGKARLPEVTSDSLQRGRDTFVASCGKGWFCHGLRDPHAYSADNWPRIMDRMAKKADLSDAQKQDVLRFVLAVRDVPVALAATGSASAPTKP